jgi:hypothetical protein
MNDMQYFDELKHEDEMNIEGGGPWIWVIIGVVASWVIDGGLKATTGKTGSDFVYDALSSATPVPSYSGNNSSGYAGGNYGGRTYSSGGSSF